MVFTQSRNHYRSYPSEVLTGCDFLFNLSLYLICPSRFLMNIVIYRVAAASCSDGMYGWSKFSICLMLFVWLILARDFISSMFDWLMAGRCLFLLTGDSDCSSIYCLGVAVPRWSSSILTFLTRSLTSFSYPSFSFSSILILSFSSSTSFVLKSSLSYSLRAS